MMLLSKRCLMLVCRKSIVCLYSIALFMIFVITSIQPVVMGCVCQSWIKKLLTYLLINYLIHQQETWSTSIAAQLMTLVLDSLMPIIVWSLIDSNSNQWHLKHIQLNLMFDHASDLNIRELLSGISVKV